MGNILKHGIDMYRQTINLKNTQFPEDQILLQNDQKSSGKFYKTTKSPGKTVKPSGEITAPYAKKPKESKYARDAKFLILIGSENAAGILSELDPEQVTEISKEIALAKVIKPEERDEILAEFQEIFSKRYSVIC